MTLISKVKTLVEYAKLGEFTARRLNGETLIDEVFFPRAITKYTESWTNTCTRYCKKVTGYLKTFGGGGVFGTNKIVEEVDLPCCISFEVAEAHGPTGNVGEYNTVLKTVKMPSLRVITPRQFCNLQALEYLELGATTSFVSNTLIGSNSLTEFYVKEGTTSNIYLQHCPLITKECLHLVIENYADMSDNKAPVFYVGAENLAKIDKEYITILENKNIDYQ